MIQILLASYKGETYLLEQIESIAAQVDVRVDLLISDDDDVAATSTLIQPYEAQIVSGPHQGVNANFLHLLHLANPKRYTLFSYADQDDVWLPNKLVNAKRALDNQPHPLKVYMGRTMVCDEELKPQFLSKGKPKEASFKNALLESIAGGNTMVFTSSTLALLQKTTHPVHHDWLTYLATTACGGQIIFDDTYYVLYRQHGQNVIGANNGFLAKLYRLKKLLSNEFYNWATNNIQALSAIRSDMTAENQAIFDGFIKLHQMQGWRFCFKRLSLFIHLGLYRQRRIEHFGFMLAAFLGKI